MQLKFNLSPSAISLYTESQLRFYCVYIAKLPVDTNVIQIYGKAGTLVHSCMEMYAALRSPQEILDFFESEWSRLNLHKLRGLTGKVLDKKVYWNSVVYGIAEMRKYNITHVEEECVFPLVDNEEALINIKGFIDVVAKDENGDTIIIDYKTSSSVGSFDTQAIHYAYSYYRKHGVAPKKAVFKYLKIKDTKIYPDEKCDYTLEDFENYEKRLKCLAEEIMSKGFDVSKYELGDINSEFNCHKEFCQIEKNRRMNVNNFTIRIKNNKIMFDSQVFAKAPFEKLLFAINLKYRYKVQGCEFSPSYQSGRWDGIKRFFRYDSLPLGFLNDFIKLFEDYVKYYGLQYKLKIVDERDLDITFKKYDTKFKDSDIVLRYYQEEAINEVMKQKIGILNMGVGSGKTITAAELIKRLNVRTLFVIHRNELIRQTVEVFEDYFGVKCGMMTEGELVVDKQVTVASVQTMNAILNGNDADKKKLLKTYLYNVSLLIMDECQFASDPNSYGNIGKYCVNTEYRVGLSGSPWRNDEATLEMNALLGFNIYTKTTKELEDEDFLVPTTCIFIDNSAKIVDEPENYNDAYDLFVAENSHRNKLACDVINMDCTKKYMVVTKKVSHAEKLHELLPNSVMVIGRLSKKDRIQAFEDFKSGKSNIMIGSQSILATGINIPDCDVIINMTAHKSDILSVQTIGRVKRKSPRKVISYYVDFVDSGSIYFKKASKERRKILSEYGNKVVVMNEDGTAK